LPFGNQYGCPWPNNCTFAQVFGSAFGDGSTWPGDGGDAVPGGKSGTGGDGGDLWTSLNLITNYVENSGGRAGPMAKLAIGGRPGQPNPAYRAQYGWSLFRGDGRWVITAEHGGKFGKDAPAP